MRKIYYVSYILIILVINSCRVEKSLNSVEGNISGSYSVYIEEFNGSKMIDLYSDSTFKYYYRFDMIYEYSTGKYSTDGHYLYLKSDMNINNLPCSVDKLKYNTLDSIKIILTSDYDSKAMKLYAIFNDSILIPFINNSASIKGTNISNCYVMAKAEKKMMHSLYIINNDTLRFQKFNIDSNNIYSVAFQEDTLWKMFYYTEYNDTCTLRNNVLYTNTLHLTKRKSQKEK